MPSFPSFRQSAHQGPELSIRSHVSPKTRPSTNDTTTYASPYDSPHLSSATATDGVEAKALALTKTLHWVRIGLATLTLAVSIAVVGCTGDTLHMYYWAQPGAQWQLRLVPAWLDRRPTTALLVSSSLIAFTSLIYIIAAILPFTRRRPTLHTTLSTTTTLTALTLSIFGLTYSQVLTHRIRTGRDPTSTSTLVNWACKWSHPGAPAPAIFKTVCREGRAVVVLMGVVIGLEVLALGVCAAAWVVLGKVRRERRERGRGKGEGML